MSRLLKVGAVVLAASLLSGQAPPPALQAPNPCAAPEYSQFDFWVGRWDVYGPKGKHVANSLIEKVYGCGIRENWMPIGSAGGGSLNIYVASTKQWEQFWIDSGGSRAHFTGGWDGKAMVLNGDWGKPTRMTYTKNADGSVRQLVEQSSDEGKSWATAYDFTYRPHTEG
jgi:hypothetical protein